MRSVVILTTDSNKEVWTDIRADLDERSISHEIHRIDINGKSLEDAVERAEKIHAIAILASSSVDANLPDIISKTTWMPVIGLTKFNTYIKSNCPILHESDAALFVFRMLYPHNLKVKNTFLEEINDNLYKKMDFSCKFCSKPKIKIINYHDHNILLYSDGRVFRAVDLDANSNITELAVVCDGEVLSISYTDSYVGLFTSNYGFNVIELVYQREMIGKGHVGQCSYPTNCIFSTIANKNAALYFCSDAEKKEINFKSFDNKIHLTQLLPADIKQIIPSFLNNIILLITNHDMLRIYDIDKKIIWKDICGYNPDDYYAAIVQCVINEKYLGILGISLKSEVYRMDILSTNDYKLCFSFSDMESTITCFDIDYVHKEICFANDKMELIIQNIENGDLRQKVKYNKVIHSISCSEDGRYIAVTNTSGDIEVLKRNS